MLIGQILLIVSTPFLTRIYSPEDFGLFAVFGALTSISIAVVALRYDSAIPLEQNDRAARALVAGVFLASSCFSIVVSLAILAGGTAFTGLLEVPELMPLLWLLPPCILLWGCGSGLSFWSMRQGTFRLNGVNRIVHHGTQAIGQLGLGLAGLGVAGLVLGYAMGYLARFAHFLTALSRAEIEAFASPSLGEIGAVLRRYWRHPVFAASAAALQSSSAMLPAVLIAMLYGPAMAGWYALAQRVVALPMRLLGEAASEVFLSELRTVDHVGMIRLFKRTTALFAGIGVAVIVPLVLVAPWLFTIIFGEAWHETGIIIQLLSPLYISRFVVHPILHTLNILHRQDLQLLSSSLTILTLAVSFFFGWWQELDAHWTIILFSICSSLIFVGTIFFSWRILLNANWSMIRSAQ